MHYLNYDEYVSLGGSLEESTFKVLINDVESKLNSLTYGRLKKFESVPMQVKLLIVRLMKLYAENDSSKVVTSYSNGIESFGYKVDDNSSSGSTGIDSKIYAITKEYLWEYPELTYRGFDNNGC